jgi:hypothetical protein
VFATLVEREVPCDWTAGKDCTRRHGAGSWTGRRPSPPRAHHVQQSAEHARKGD